MTNWVENKIILYELLTEELKNLESLFECKISLGEYRKRDHDLLNKIPVNIFKEFKEESVKNQSAVQKLYSERTGLGEIDD